MRKPKMTVSLAEQIPYLYRNDRAKQIKILKSLAPKNSRAKIENAYELIKPAGNLTEVEQVEKAGMILAVANALPESDDRAREQFPGFSVPESAVIIGEFLKAIRPRVEEIRREFWGQAFAPFPMDQGRALSWLQAQARTELRRQEIAGRDSREARKHGAHRIGKRWYRGPLDWLPFEGADNVLIAKEGPLGRLLELARELVGETPFSENAHPFRSGAIVRYLLTDVPPLFVRYRINKVSGAVPTRVELTTWRALRLCEVREIYLAVKERFGRQHPKLLTAANQRLYELIERHGGRPKKGCERFWTMIMHEWNRRNPRARYSTPNGPRMAYERIVKRVASTAANPATPSARPQSWGGHR
jgi:hypothetical protein